MGSLAGTPAQPQELGPTGTGGGNIGIGNVPVPGEDTFSGTNRAAAPTGEGSPIQKRGRLNEKNKHIRCRWMESTCR